MKRLLLSTDELLHNKEIISIHNGVMAVYARFVTLQVSPLNLFPIYLQCFSVTLLHCTCLVTSTAGNLSARDKKRKGHPRRIISWPNCKAM